MLTWKDNKLLVYSDLMKNGAFRPTYEKEITLPSDIGEGWGITHDDNYLYISNGSTTIFICVPSPDGTTLNIVRTITMDKPSQTTIRFNEIEMRDNSAIYANDYLTNQIFKISKNDGK